MKEFLFIFESDSIFSEIKIRAITIREAERILKTHVKISENEIVRIIEL